MTFSAREALANAVAQLHAAGVESPRLDGRVLLAVATSTSPEQMFAGEDLRAEEYERFASLVARRVAREPLAYITGHKEFWSLSFAVGPGVLVPRPETETLVEAALHESPTEEALRVLDIGTGSGCLLVAFLSERPKAAGVGIDVSESALAWARRNAVTLGLASRCHLEPGCLEPAGTDVFDVILSNPPYLTAAEFGASAPEIRDHEPRVALVAGEDGFEAYRALGPVLRRRLARQGKAFVEIGAGQAPHVAEILALAGLDVHVVIPDLSGTPRCLIAGQPENGGQMSRRKNSVGNVPSNR